MTAGGAEFQGNPRQLFPLGCGNNLVFRASAHLQPHLVAHTPDVGRFREVSAPAPLKEPAESVAAAAIKWQNAAIHPIITKSSSTKAAGAFSSFPPGYEQPSGK